MPTKHERIAVIKDEQLAAALDSVAPLVAADTPTAALVHDLAIRGARALRDEDQQRRDSIERLIEWSTRSADPPWDPETLARIDELTRE
jgi:hypothetical protein